LCCQRAPHTRQRKREKNHRKLSVQSPCPLCLCFCAGGGFCGAFALAQFAAGSSKWKATLCHCLSLLCHSGASGRWLRPRTEAEPSSRNDPIAQRLMLPLPSLPLSSLPKQGNNRNQTERPLRAAASSGSGSLSLDSRAAAAASASGSQP
jgi:hypothetical protein